MPSFAENGSNIFQVNQATGANYRESQGWVACGAGYCKTTLQPLKVIDLGGLNASNTTLLQSDLAVQKPDYTIVGYGPSQNLNFNVSFYQAVNNGGTGGAQIGVDLTAQGGAALPPNLHWVQIVNDNYNLTGVNGSDLAAPMGPGEPENLDDAPGVTSPYYDQAAAVAMPPFNATPPHFEDFSRRAEPTAANPVYTWDADLYLVSDPGTKDITVYNGVEWGWTTVFSSAVPEPEAWTLMLLGVGAIGWACRRNRARLAQA